ncbi:sulfite exporter TauE/SafE family protein [Mycetocola sp. CAN_C7]|uniref:sulfite exporter TauE/SafE family protein n=1 Tax=Mycetocola sp. CAN_C7 TaxID=2787724 RepID=UPI002FF1C326
MFAGAIAQRVSGMGFALVAAPALVLLIGPFDGVLMVNLCGAASALIVCTRVWRHIQWKRYVLLAIPALLAIVPGVLISIAVSGPTLQIVVGVILGIALTTSLLVTRGDYTTPAVPTGIVAGSVSGLMSATAGVSGPAVGIFAVLTNWEHRSFAATLQPFFATLGLSAFVSKIIATGGILPDHDWWLWLVVIACTLAGLVAGELVAKRVSVRAARASVIAISYLGAAAAIVDGALSL